MNVETPDTSPMICELPTAFSSLAARERASAQIQDEIAAAKEVIRSRHQRLNDLSLISRLPPELLAGVFKHLRDQYPTIDISWICSVSQICSRWRHVALECPSLWTNIPFDHPKWAQEMLARSKTAALNVVFDNNARHYRMKNVGGLLISVIKTAALELSRIKNLHLSRNCRSIDMAAVHREIIELLDAPAPFLETAEIAHTNLVNLFAGVSPRLTSLVLSDCSLNSVRFPMVGNLRTLKLLRVCSQASDDNIPVDQFISALCAMNRLEILHVTHSLNNRHIGIPPAQQVAELPHLTEFFMDTLLSNWIFLLDHIVYPTSTRVCATYRGIDSAGKGHDTWYLYSFAEKLGSRVLGPIRSVELRKDGIKAWRSLYTSELAFHSDLEIPLPPLCNFERVVKCFIQSLDLIHLESLNFDCPFSAEFLMTYFGQLSHLATITVGKQAMTFNVLQALVVGLTTSPARPTKLNFLALETLHIEGWDFEERHQAEILISYLKRRKETGAPLSNLIINQCLHVDEGLHVDALRAVVGKVEWDGLSNYTEEEDSEYECDAS
ncbi:hypothetical protein DXG03_008567 [Asterophora parasitica]|uniref:F-box domain-containing protein n=1 Tax=Asterophora parasitica TaxID=117018 RepID=A0A9P7KCZ9_9AGAR|nr:hypothetical protein DXG03_008567 [Asterophora parasitica]